MAGFLFFEVIYLELYEGEGWYFKAREKFLRGNLTDVKPTTNVLDVGCGNGLVNHVLKHCNVTGIDSHPRYEGAITAAATAIPFSNSTFDAVTCFDVLEHIEDHEKAINEIARVLKPGGRGYFSVPLYPQLWSKHDELTGHVRRYRTGELYPLLNRSGLKVLKKQYFICSLLPLVFVIRLFFPSQKVSSTVKARPALEKLLLCLCQFDLYLRLPFGLTEFIEVRKEDGDC